MEVSQLIRSFPAWYTKLANSGASQERLNQLEAEDEEESRTVYYERRKRAVEENHWQKVAELRREAGIKEREGVITPEEIARAKKFPLVDILKINSAGFSRCFKHDEKVASLYCKKNFVHCFSCGWTGDTIAILMERDGMNFVEAVKKLS